MHIHRAATWDCIRVRRPIQAPAAFEADMSRAIATSSQHIQNLKSDNAELAAALRSITGQAPELATHTGVDGAADKVGAKEITVLVTASVC